MMVLITITVATDRMIGVLLCVSLVGYAVIGRSKSIAILSGFAITLFSILVIIGFNASGIEINNIRVASVNVSEYYNPTNLIVFFLVINGLLFVPAAFGYLHLKSNLLKIPLFVSLSGSFSWLVFPDYNLLVADRWIILSGIFLSIFAGYGIIEYLFKKFKHNFASVLAGCVLTIFASVGLVYAIMPYDSPFILYGIAQSGIENFFPLTMQFNSLDIKDNGKLLSAIDWINRNTEPDVVIVGEKHWRGYMELYVEEQRIYRFSEDPHNLAQSLINQGHHVYLFKSDNNLATKFRVVTINE